MATVNEQILSYLNNSKEGDELTILVNVQGTEFFVIYNPTTDRFERVLYSNVFNGDKIKDYLGYTPEDVANKATDFSTINNELYASLQAIKDYIDFLKSNPNGLAATDSDGKILTSQLPPIAITSVILAAETTISDFATNSGNYTFEQGDVIVLDNGNGSYFMYNGGVKTDVNSYNQITASEVDWSQIVNIPVEVRFPSLDVVLNNGNTSSKGIIIGENIVVAPVGSPVTSTGSNSIGFTANDKFFITQIPENGGKLLSFDISNLTGSREIDIPDFGGTLLLLSSTETNDGDLAITGSFTGKGDGITDVNASELGGELPSYYDFRNFGLGQNTILNNNWNTIDKTGYYYNDTTSAIGIPGLFTDIVLHHINYGVTASVQTAYRLGAVYQIWYRRKTSSTWGDWTEFITEDNISNYTGLPSGFYEEGTFTPTLVDSLGGATFSIGSNNCSYVRNGNSVTVSFDLSAINKSSGTQTGNLQLTGLPFTVSETASASIGRIEGHGQSFYELFAAAAAGGNVIQFNRKTTLTGDSNSAFQPNFSGGILRLSINYITNVYTP